MKVILSTVFVSLLAFTSIIAQHSKVNWGPEIKSSQINTIIGADDSHFYVLNMRGKSFSSKKEYKVLKIDRTTQKVHNEILFDRIFKKNEYFINGKINKDYFEGLFVSGKKLELVKVDMSGKFLKNETVELLEDKIVQVDKYGIPPNISKSNFSISRYIMYKEDSSIQAIESEDGSKCLTEIIYLGEKTDEVYYTVYDKDNSYQPVYNFSFFLEKDELRERIQDVYINNDGKMAILLKQYFSRDEREHKNKKPNYSFALLNIDLQGNITEVDLGTSKQFWVGGSLTMDSNDNVIITTMTEEKPEKGANKALIMKYDISGNQKFIKNHKLKGFKKGKDKLDKSYRVAEILRCNDNLYFFISKNDEIRQHKYLIQKGEKHISKNKYLENLYYDTNDILVDGFDGEGNYLWSKKIYRHVKEKNSHYFSEASILTEETGIKLYLNSDLKRVNNFENEKGKLKILPTKKNVIIEIEITSDGEMKYSSISDPDKYAIGIETVKRIDGNTYFISMDKKLAKMKVGVMN